MKKTRTPKWEKPLRKHLLQNLPDYTGLVWLNNGTPVSKVVWASANTQAINEIIRGVAFLKAKDLLVVTPLLSRDFDINNICGCLLAKITGEYFEEALYDLKISIKTARSIGCAPPFGAQRLQDTSWKHVYNHLWKQTGKFLKEHPEFGIE